MLSRILSAVLIASLIACSSELAVSPENVATKKINITTLDQITALPGDQVSFAGQNLSLDLQIFVNGKQATYKLDSASSGTFIVPDDVDPGLMQVSFKMKDRNIKKFPLMNGNSDDIPIVPVPEESVCSTLIFKNSSGTVVRGLANCDASTCSSDGETDCLSTAEFPAVPAEDLSSKVAAGSNLAGVSGEACNVDSSEYRATISGAPTGTNDVISFTATIAGDHITHYRYKLRSSSDPDCSNVGSYSGELPVSFPIGTNVASRSNGLIELCVLGKDDSGNWQSSPTTASWTKNRSAIAATFAGLPIGTSNNGSLNIPVAGDGVTDYKYKIREPSDPPCSDPSGYSSETSVSVPITDSLSGFADGLLELCVIGRDASGTWQAPSDGTSFTWMKDTTAPTATLANAPTGTNNAVSLDITVAGTDVAFYKYKVRESATSACSVAADYSSEIAVSTKITNSIASLADGALEICVIGRDLAGNWQTEAAATTASWTKDTSAPTASISGQPSGTNNTTALNITIAGADVTHYKYKLRTTADSACSNATGYSAETAVAFAVNSSIAALSDGLIEICVVGRDASGNWQTYASASSASWTKDSLAPAATLSGDPTGTNSNTALNITVAGTDVVEYKYKVRAAADSSCSNSTGYSAAIVVATPITDNISALADGTIQICVIGKDSYGNWQLEGTATTASWTKDTLPPTATISNAPASTNNTTLLDITIGGTDVTHYKYKIREPADAACSAASGYSAQVAVGTKVSNNIAALADGAIELCVIGRDSSGNWQTEASATSATWTKDTSAPVATLSGEPTGTNSTTTLNVTIAGADVTHYKFKVRDTSTTACSNATGYSSEIAVASLIGSDISALSDGTIELCVIGRDAYGNWQATASATAVTWTKDALPPAATLSGVPSGSSLTTSLDITVGGTDVVEYKYKIRESADLPCSNSTGYSSAIAVATHITNDISGLADGTFQVCVIGKDGGGNWQLEGVATAASWTKDTLAPVATITDAPTGTSATTVLNVTIAGTDVSEYKYKIRESATTACSNSTGYSAATAVATKITDSISALADGTIELCVIGKDSAGNWQAEASATTVNWTKDTSAPTATISGEPTGTNTTTLLNITIAGADVTHYKFKVRDTSTTACSNATGYSSENGRCEPHRI